ncbi:hypothetical protein DA798_07710 [Lactobacillus sp. PFC-70]|nr:hypothetical protein DA798_07710 [Lactobacillus sp. PFC-70]
MNSKTELQQLILNKESFILVYTTNSFSSMAIVEKLKSMNLKSIPLITLDINTARLFAQSQNVIVAPTTVEYIGGVEKTRFFGNRTSDFIKSYLKEII